MGRIIGIDIGTTNSVVAVMEGGEPTIIPSAEGGRTVPSVVGYVRSGERLVGQIAKRQAVTNPRNTIASIKRFMGRRADDAGLAAERAVVAYEVVAEGDGLRVRLEDGRTFAPAEISAMIIAKLKADAEAFIGEKITEAVITVPAYFDDAQRQATKDAGRIAGIDVKRIVNEPTAAALAYGLDRKGADNRRVAVFDIGGGTFDISVIEIGDGVVEVRATNGDTHIGGDDFDLRIVDWVATQFKQNNGIDLRTDPQALQRIRESAEKAKIELSTIVSTELNLPYITADATGPKHIALTLTRAQMESLTADLVERTKAPVTACLTDASVTPAEIDEVILVGGMTRMPAVMAAVKALFGKEPSRTVNPDEVVAMGAAVQAGILSGSVKDLLLIDVTPLTLSIETRGGVATGMIERNTTIPTAKTEVFSTAADLQDQVEVHAVQGERPMAVDNRSLGRFVLTGIPPAPAGVPQVEVTFEIDANGILEVRAKDRATAKSQSVRITGSSMLSADEVARMVGDAERFRADDKRRREAVDARNAADAVLLSAERAIVEIGEKVAPSDRAEAERAIAALRTAPEDDAPGIISRTDAVRSVMSKIGAAAYAAAAAAASTAPAEEQVIDGEATEVATDPDARPA
jgi:molecular chaperone DnaK